MRQKHFKDKYIIRKNAIQRYNYCNILSAKLVLFCVCLCCYSNKYKILNAYIKNCSFILNTNFSLFNLVKLSSIILRGKKSFFINDLTRRCNLIFPFL